MSDLTVFSKNLPQTPGVYLFYSDHGVVVYVGKARNLRVRVSSYFSNPRLLFGKTRQMVTSVRSIKTMDTLSEFDALILEASLIKKYRPKYNVIWRDDKHPLYVKIPLHDPFPILATVRKEDNSKSLYFGPFPKSRTVKQVLRYLRRIFPYCTVHNGRKPCFYTHLGLCDPCPGAIKAMQKNEAIRQKRRYRASIRQIIRVLTGKSDEVIKKLQKDMEQLSRSEQYEKAAILRDQIDRLRYLTELRFTSSDYLANPNLASDVFEKQKKELLAFLHALGRAHALDFTVPGELDRIECFDIANISGKQAVGSMVVLSHGEIAPQFYRRFRIRLTHTPDDPGMIAEVLHRRLKHLDWPRPNVILVDGGRAQVAAARLVVRQAGTSIPVIGLAKRLEEIVLPLSDGHFMTIRLREASGALYVLQRIRDEAHRFANTYHRTLRKKQLTVKS